MLLTDTNNNNNNNNNVAYEIISNIVKKSSFNLKFADMRIHMHNKVINCNCLDRH